MTESNMNSESASLKSLTPPADASSDAGAATLEGLTSIRVPVTPANREYLRTLRQLELDAWQEAAPASNDPAPRLGTAWIMAHDPVEDRLLAAAAVAALAAAGSALFASLNFIGQWARFEEFVRRLIV